MRTGGGAGDGDRLDRECESGRVRALIGLSRLGISRVGMGGGKKYGAS